MFQRLSQEFDPDTPSNPPFIIDDPLMYPLSDDGGPNQPGPSQQQRFATEGLGLSV